MIKGLEVIFVKRTQNLKSINICCSTLLSAVVFLGCANISIAEVIVIKIRGGPLDISKHGQCVPTPSHCTKKREISGI